MTTLSGIVEEIEHAIGLLQGALAKLPGDVPTVQALRAAVEYVTTTVDLSAMRVAMAEVESKASATAQDIADHWPEEPTKR